MLLTQNSLFHASVLAEPCSVKLPSLYVIWGLANYPSLSQGYVPEIPNQNLALSYDGNTKFLHGPIVIIIAFKYLCLFPTSQCVFQRQGHYYHNFCIPIIKNSA